MLLIAESGSTKCDWRIYDDDGHRLDTFRSLGINPNFLTVSEIHNVVTDISGFSKYFDFVEEIYFFGAGCSDEKANRQIETALHKVFKKSHIIVEHDLKASAYACYQGSPAICCILGTGSNSCYFDGEDIREEVPSLAYILGDEGGGVYFGKKLLTAYFYNQLPESVHADFEDLYPDLTLIEMKERVYKDKRPNTFLASFMPFVVKHKKEPLIKDWIAEGLDLFIRNHVLCFPEAREVPIHFVGSVAKVLRPELEAQLTKNNLTLGQIIQEPAQALAQYIFSHKR